MPLEVTKKCMGAFSTRSQTIQVRCNMNILQYRMRCANLMYSRKGRGGGGGGGVGNSLEKLVQLNWARKVTPVEVTEVAKCISERFGLLPQSRTHPNTYPHVTQNQTISRFSSYTANRTSSSWHQRLILCLAVHRQSLLSPTAYIRVPGVFFLQGSQF